ncbi:hypothetical protein [Hymenobacter nivis]|uniref:hypothetical protein n=1 Tax=Hymenobacter nivis TaxID=1850093 RepID=UPI001878D41F|nr:hypothetical protein [Hymenobacter nivis]
MLEPDEATLVRQAQAEGMRLVEEEYRRRCHVFIPMQLDGVARMRQPMLEMYRLLTGFAETNPNAVRHHEVAQYGPPCPACQKPLRTPQARFCAACGFGQADVQPGSLPLAERRPELFG